jgi:hypothetical protein
LALGFSFGAAAAAEHDQKPKVQCLKPIPPFSIIILIVFIMYISDFVAERYGANVPEYGWSGPVRGAAWQTAKRVRDGRDCDWQSFVRTPKGQRNGENRYGERLTVDN